MKTLRINFFVFSSIIFFSFLLSSCEKEKETETDPICFTVSQYSASVTVNNLWNSGSSQQVDLTGIAAATIKVTRENESHVMEFNNVIKNSWIIQSFDVIIDGKSYSYPKDACE